MSLSRKKGTGAGTGTRSGFSPTKSLGIQSFLGGLFLALLLAAGLSLSVIGYRIVSMNVERAAVRRSDALTRTVRRQLELSVHAPIESFLDRAVHGRLGKVETLEERLAFLPVLRPVVQTNSFIGGVMVGYGNGDFFLVRIINTAEEKSRSGAPPGTVLLVLASQVGPSDSRVHMLFFDNDLNLISRRESSKLYEFDPRNRTWYATAMQVEGRAETGPYIFPETLRPGIVLSQKGGTGTSVIGVIVHLEQVSDILNEERPTPGSRIALFNGGRQAVASAFNIPRELRDAEIEESEIFSPVIKRAMELHGEGKRGDGLAVRVDGRDWLVSLEDLDQFSATKYVLAVAIPRDELFAEAGQFFRDGLIGLAGLLILTATLIWIAGRNVGKPIQALAEQANRTPASGGETHPQPKSGLEEIQALAWGVSHLHHDVRKVLALLNVIGAERNTANLLERVVEEIVGMVDVHGGILVLWDDKAAKPATVRAFWVDALVDDTTLPANDGTPRLIMYDAMEWQLTMKATITRDDPRAQLGPMRPAFNDPSVVHVDVICVPLFDRDCHPLGVFSLSRRVVAGQEDAISYPSETVTFIEAIARALSIVIETQNLIEGQCNLRDALIHILAGAIDAKSPYTGGHCARVPIIFHMLLQAAHDAGEGQFRDFVLDENDWETARLAAWLHDCGKVTTPEYVVDKATKLETLYDRIHEVRTRFEVLKRDAEIASLQAVLAGADRRAERLRLVDELRRLDDDFAFVAFSNLGGETMDADDAARLREIGRRTWTRTLDKRMGVSREECMRMNKAGVGAAPARETVLADNPEHIIPRGEKDRFTYDNRWGFKLAMPEALYNRGELYNLLIPRGTLTEEERYKINDHITKTIVMLDMLPLPKELAGVPKIAGVHHERMDGRGYPRGLRREEMDWPGRMMAIADIFEALTASDRPYRSNNRLSEALEIMAGMKAGNHIDPDLFDLFIGAKIPQRYAAEYLSPEQIDM